MAVLRGQQFAGGLGDAGGPGAAGRVPGPACPGAAEGGCRAPRQLLRAGAAPRAAAKAFGTAGSPTCGIAYDEGNIFSKIVAGEVPCFKLFETEHALAILDAFPMCPGHSLLLPKADGYATIMDMPEAAAADLLRELPRLARAVAAATGSDGVNVLQNNGAAGQAVFHVHFHVVPRMEGDGLVKLGAHGSGAMLSPEAAAPIQEGILAHL